MGGEIENGSQKDNNYVVFPRVGMTIPAPRSRFFYIFHTDDRKTSKLSVPLKGQSQLSISLELR